MCVCVCVRVCVCVCVQGDANRSDTDDDRQSLSYEDEEKLRELYAAGTACTAAWKYTLTLIILVYCNLGPVVVVLFAFPIGNKNMNAATYLKVSRIIIQV